MIDDLKKELNAILYERIASPLAWNLILSWIAWNYQFLLIIASSLPVKEKLSLLNSLHPSFLWDGALHFVVGPVTTAVLLILLFPYPAKWAYQIWQKRQKELREIRTQTEDQTMLTVEESRELKRALFQREKEFEEELKRKDAQIERIRFELTQREEPVSEIKKQSPAPVRSDVIMDALRPAKDISDQDVLSNPLHRKIIYSIEILEQKGRDKLFVEALSESAGVGRMQTQHFFDKLLDGKYVMSFNDDGGTQFYKLTSKGREFVIKLVDFKTKDKNS